METVKLFREEGLIRLRLERGDRSVNVLDETCLSELEAQLDALEKKPPQLLVFESGMPGCFVAGADVDVIAAVSDVAEATRLAERGQSLMRRIEDLPCPSIAVVAGACMGGGLEMALACDYILAIQTAKTSMALPEIKTEELSRWFIAESPAIREIITVLTGNSKRGWIISNPLNPSTKRLLGIKVKKTAGNEAFVNTVEYWYLRWWYKNDNSYVYPYRETNRQTYILRRDTAGWKVYENLRPLPKISLPQRWKKRKSCDPKVSD